MATTGIGRSIRISNLIYFPTCLRTPRLANCGTFGTTKRIDHNPQAQKAMRFSLLQNSSDSSSLTTELDDDFSGVICPADSMFTIAGFGSLLSESSARSTFPDLLNFRLARVDGYRRVFAHACDIFFERGIARPETGEISSLSVEQHADSKLIVTLFEVLATPEAINAFIQREHEFKFVAVKPTPFDDCNSNEEERTAVICARNTDEAYRAKRCPPAEWSRRYGRHGLTSIWREDVLPCRVYLRHCALAAARLGPVVEANFLDETVLADRKTTIRAWLKRNPEILDELPPESLIGRYSG